MDSLFQTNIMVALSEFYQREGYLEKLLTQHREILEAIEDRDPEQAQQAMRTHLEMVEEKMNEFLDTE